MGLEWPVHAYQPVYEVHKNPHLIRLAGKTTDEKNFDFDTQNLQTDHLGFVLFTKVSVNKRKCINLQRCDKKPNT